MLFSSSYCFDFEIAVAGCIKDALQDGRVALRTFNIKQPPKAKKKTLKLKRFHTTEDTLEDSDNK